MIDPSFRSGPIALDAGMGARLIAQGLDPRRDDPALWTIDRPDEVLAIHLRDRSAGAGALTTCTFGANRPTLEALGRGRDLERLNRAAVALARRAAGSGGFVLGNLGPRVAEQPGAAAEQAAALAAEGVDALVLETFTPESILGVLDELAAATGRDFPVIASLWRWPDPPGPLARRLIDAGAAAVGMNCRAGAAAALAFTRSLAGAGEIPLYLRPSAQAGDSDSSPLAFAAAVAALVAAGGRLLGGCCGATEDHVAAVALAITRLKNPTQLQAAPTP